VSASKETEVGKKANKCNFSTKESSYLRNNRR